MITDSKEIQDKLPQIMKRFNAVLDELGIEGEVLRLMIGDSENPDHVAAQESST